MRLLRSTCVLSASLLFSAAQGEAQVGRVAQARHVGTCSRPNMELVRKEDAVAFVPDLRGKARRTLLRS
jgi:hypothetical protein